MSDSPGIAQIYRAFEQILRQDREGQQLTLLYCVRVVLQVAARGAVKMAYVIIAYISCALLWPSFSRNNFLFISIEPSSNVKLLR